MGDTRPACKVLAMGAILGRSLDLCRDAHPPTRQELGVSWYYCLVHQKVEPEAGCPNSERLGPFSTEAEAAKALELAHERNAAFDEDD
jgi:hypothetical protein